ncbi:autotransporter outer membrane beta-barrel domain-containing protein [Bosea sp. 117]|uniref:autotransporter outer membrane beta-barrel domain-containing protein n=1 Tax=Bosea sp. 117 TaxID=1125973 RepID=UPI000493D235|nr:autotransporter outer membrane beta-barrel domain-containing protein [Bosea sp. 117]
MRHLRRTACLTAATATIVVLAQGGAYAEPRFEMRFPCASPPPPPGAETRLPGSEMMAQPADRAGLPASTATWSPDVTIAWPLPRECLASPSRTGDIPDRLRGGAPEKTLGYAPDPDSGDANPFTVLDRSLGGPGADLTARPAPAARIEPNFIWSRALGTALPFDAVLPDPAGADGDLAGIELPLDEDLAIGLAGGWIRSRFAIDGGDGRLEAEDWRSAFYAVTREDNWQASGLIAYEYGTVADPLAAFAAPAASRLDAGFADGAEVTAGYAEARAELSYVYVLGDAVSLAPYGAAGASWVQLDSLADGATGLTATQEAAWPFTVIGLRLSGTLDLGAALVTPRLDLGWQHVVGDVDPLLLFGADGPVPVAGVPLAENSLVVRAGFDAAFAESRWRSALRYSGDIAPENQQHTVTGGLALPF